MFINQSVSFCLQHILAHPVPWSIWSAFVPDLADARGTVAAGAPLPLPPAYSLKVKVLEMAPAATGIWFPRTLSSINGFGLVSLEAEPEIGFIV